MVEQLPSVHKTLALISPVPKGKKEKMKQKTMEVNAGPTVKES